MFENLETEKLVSLIERWNKRYWIEGSSDISDDRYDSAIRELTNRIPTHELINKINIPFVYSTEKINHPNSMLSLNKAYSIEEIIKWAKSIARDENELFIIQPKYDGLAGRFDGKILSTRGDGSVGENVSDKIPLIEAHVVGYKSIPLTCLHTDTDILGEILITKSEFQKWTGKIKKQDGTEYNNSRNAISGIMGLKDISEIKKYNPILTFVDYNFQKSPSYTISELEVMWEGILRTYEKTDYPLDGLVIRLKDKEYFNELGNTEHHPRGAIAFKFANQSAQTELLEVEWSFGKNCLTPVAIIKETVINGIKINRATLHNIQNIIDNDIQIGDILELERAGDVIPYVKSSKPGKSRRSALIRECPSCGALLERRSVELVCPNTKCKGTLLENLYASVKTLGIDELGRPTLQKILDKYDIKNMIDLFNIKLNELKNLPGFGEKSASTLYDNIQNSLCNTRERILGSMNIPLIGIGIAKKILMNLSLEELIEAPRSKIAETIGVGEERVTAIRKFIKQNQQYICEYIAMFTISAPETPISGKTICFTGKMPLQRSEYEKMAKQAGYIPVNSVDKKLNLLVVSDDTESFSSKMAKAKKYNVQMNSLSEWLKGINK